MCLCPDYAPLLLEQVSLIGLDTACSRSGVRAAAVSDLYVERDAHVSPFPQISLRGPRRYRRSQQPNCWVEAEAYAHRAFGDQHFRELFPKECPMASFAYMW